MRNYTTVSLPKAIAEQVRIAAAVKRVSMVQAASEAFRDWLRKVKEEKNGKI